MQNRNYMGQPGLYLWQQCVEIERHTGSHHFELLIIIIIIIIVIIIIIIIIIIICLCKNSKYIFKAHRSNAFFLLSVAASGQKVSLLSYGKYSTQLVVILWA